MKKLENIGHKKIPLLLMGFLINIKVYMIIRELLRSLHLVLCYLLLDQIQLHRLHEFHLLIRICAQSDLCPHLLQ